MTKILERKDLPNHITLLICEVEEDGETYYAMRVYKKKKLLTSRFSIILNKKIKEEAIAWAKELALAESA